MPTFLNLTNGRLVVPKLRDAGIPGPIVPWDDVLHEGPVPFGLNPAALRERRAEFLASCGWGTTEAIARDLAARDAALDDLPRVDEVMLWFEHDLYDQLQRLQILDRLPLDGAPRVSAVPDDRYLGELSTAELQGLFAARREVTTAQRLAARDAWDAFRSPDPRHLVEVLPRAEDLPPLRSALVRHLEQFPSIDDGLSRTERQALEVIGRGVTRAVDVYRASHHGREPAIFMGDSAFLFHIGGLVRSPRPLLSTSRPARHLSPDDDLTLTDEGRRVLDGDGDRVAICGIDRWLGGVHLSGNGAVWRWDGQVLRVR